MGVHDKVIVGMAQHDGKPVEHGVEGGDLVHADVGHAKNLGDGIHGSDWQPPYTLT